LKSYKSPCIDEISAELIQAGGELLLSAIHKLINFIWNKEELPDQWKESYSIVLLKLYGTHQFLAYADDMSTGK
jgi:hypothetical protein